MAQNSPAKSRKSSKPAAEQPLVLNMLQSADDARIEIADKVDAELAALLDSVDALVVDDAPVNTDADVIEVDAAASDEPAAEVVEVVAAEPAPGSDTEGSAIDELLGQLGLDAAGPTLSEIADAVDAVEAAEVAAAEASIDGATDGAAPTGDDTDLSAADPEVEPGKKGKKVATPRKHYGRDKVTRIKDKLGDSVNEYTVLTVDDAGLDEDALKAKVDETFATIKGMNTKEANRAANFIEFVAGKKGSLNEVIKRVLQVLAADGYVATGVDGNMMKNLLAKPYTMASARAQGGNTLGMFKDLQVLIADGKGRFVGNPDSLLLAKANSLLGLTFKEAPPAPAAAEA